MDETSPRNQLNDLAGTECCGFGRDTATLGIAKAGSQPSFIPRSDGLMGDSVGTPTASCIRTSLGRRCRYPRQFIREIGVRNRGRDFVPKAISPIDIAAGSAQ